MSAAAGAEAIHKVVAQCITDDLFIGLALMGSAGVDPLARGGAGGLCRSRQLVAVAVLLDADQVTCDGNAAVLVFGGGGVFVDIDLSRFVGTDFVYGIGFLQRLALRNIQVDYGVVFCNDSCLLYTSPSPRDS